jgi:hypothetical protein
MINDWPLILAIDIVVAMGVDQRTVRQQAVRWLCKRRKLSKDAARARVATLLGQSYPDQATLGGDAVIDFDFVLAAVHAIHGEVVAARLATDRAREWCYRSSSGFSDDRLSRLFLEWEIRQALEPPTVITDGSQNVDLPASK